MQITWVFVRGTYILWVYEKFGKTLQRGETLYSESTESCLALGTDYYTAEIMRILPVVNVCFACDRVHIDCLGPRYRTR